MKRIYLISVFISVVIGVNQLLSGGEWTLTGSLNQKRSEHCAVLLNDGRVLVAGGSGKYPEILSSCEIYDPETEQWTKTGSMQHRRRNFAMVKLNNGNILAIGGVNREELMMNFCEIYDIETEQWRETGSMNKPRAFHSAVTFRDSNGKLFVMVAAGFDEDNVDSYEIYDPETEQWTHVGHLNEPRTEFCLITMSDEVSDVILACGGNGGKTAEIWRPTTMSWSYVGTMYHNRYRHARITKISDTKALISGGWSWEEQKWLSSCEIFDSETLQFTETDSLEIGRAAHPATLLPNGKVLVSGGMNPDAGWTLRSSEIYDSQTELWQRDSDMNWERNNHTSTLLLDGQVLVVGNDGITQTELYSWNHTPEISQIQGPDSGFIGDTLYFSVNVSDPDDDSVSVRFSCDGDTSEWSAFLPSDSVFGFQYCWQNAGEYHIYIQIRDQWNPQGIHNSLSEWIVGPTVTIRDLNENQAPVISDIDSLYYCDENECLSLSFSISDPENDSVKVLVDWTDSLQAWDFQEVPFTIETERQWSEPDTLEPVIIAQDQYGAVSQFQFTVIVKPLVGINPIMKTPQFRLLQNYPNPFNSSTTIKYEIPKSSFVKINIYDINGRLIETLVNEYKNAGYYSINWNAENVVSGLYFYIIDAGDFTDFNKCLIVK